MTLDERGILTRLVAQAKQLKGLQQQSVDALNVAADVLSGCLHKSELDKTYGIQHHPEMYLGGRAMGLRHPQHIEAARETAALVLKLVAHECYKCGR